MSLTLARLGNGLHNVIENCSPLTVYGRITQISGTVVRAVVPRAKVGELCWFRNLGETHSVPAEVIGFEGEEVILAPIGTLQGMSASTAVIPSGDILQVPVGEHLLGSILDGIGRPVQGADSHNADTHYPVISEPPPPMSREIVNQVLPLGIRALDMLMTCGIGQRIGIFAGAGVGKSSLMSMLVRNASADVYVIALIGERGREVREFIDHSLGEHGMKRSIVIAATSDRPAIERLKAAHVATAVCEYFRDQGKNVLLLMDSVTRFARAQREIGLAAGEAPARNGFPPSVFAELPRLVERAGRSDKGSITAFYTVLIEGDDMSDPVADEVRSLLDGHIVLSRDLAAANHYPAIDVLNSLSRVMGHIVHPSQVQIASRLRTLMAKYEEIEFLVRVGEYQRGSDPDADEALDKIETIRTFLKQQQYEHSPYMDTFKWAQEITGIEVEQ